MTAPPDEPDCEREYSRALLRLCSQNRENIRKLEAIAQRYQCSEFNWCGDMNSSAKLSNPARFRPFRCLHVSDCLRPTAFELPPPHARTSRFSLVAVMVFGLRPGRRRLSDFFHQPAMAPRFGPGCCTTRRPVGEQSALSDLQMRPGRSP